MTTYIVDRMARGGINATMDADLVALVKAGAPTNSDRVTGQQRLCVDTTNNDIYYHDGGASTSWAELAPGGGSALRYAQTSPADKTDFSVTTSYTDLFTISVAGLLTTSRVWINALGSFEYSGGGVDISIRITDGTNTINELTPYYQEGANKEAPVAFAAFDTSPEAGTNTYKVQVKAATAGTLKYRGMEIVAIDLTSGGGSGGVATPFDISGLTQLADGGLAGTDEFAVDDSGTQKRITFAGVLKSIVNLTQHNAPSANDVAGVVDVSASVERKMTLGKMVQGGLAAGAGLAKTDAGSNTATTLAFASATDAEMVAGTLTTKAPSVKQVRDFGASASSLAVKWNGQNNIVTAGIASLAPYSDASGGAATYYDANNDRWQLLRPNVANSTGAKVGNLILEDPYFDFTQMVMAFNLTMGRNTAADNNSFIDSYWGAESDALNGSGDSWVGTNTKGIYVRCKRAATVDKLLFSVGVNDSTIRTALGSKTVGWQGRYYGPNVTGNFTFTPLAQPSTTNAAEENVVVDVASTDTSKHWISYSVLSNNLSLYVDGKLAFTLDMGFVPGVGNTYTFGPRYGIMGDDGGSVPSAMFGYLNAMILGTPDPLNADASARPPDIIVNPAGTGSTAATKISWDGTTYRFGAAWADVTSKPSGLAIIPAADSAPASPNEGDLWVDTTGSSTVLKLYDGTAWKPVDSTGRDADHSMPLLGNFDNVEEGEWVRYAASQAGAPTANAGLMAIQGGDAIALDTTTGKTYHAAVGTAYGNWSAAAAATLTNTNFATATADTIVSIGSTNTGWPAAATGSGVDYALGAKTVIGSTTYGICIVRLSYAVDYYVKVGSAAWTLGGAADATVVDHWSQVPVGKVRIVDLWAKEIGKRTATQEQRWYFSVTDEGLFSGAPQTQTRTAAQLEDWRAVSPLDVRGSPPGGNYTAVATAAAVDSAGDIHYDGATRTLTVYPKAGDEAYWDGALQQRARIWSKDASTMGDRIYGVVFSSSWSSGKITAVLTPKDLIHSTPLTTGTAYAFTAMGLNVTWGDYAEEPLPLAPSLFNNLNIGDVNRYESGTPDAPETTKRGLAWRVGDDNIVVYDESNVQWTIAKVPQTTFGTWGSFTAPGAVTSIDAATTQGLHRANASSTGGRPTDTARDFYFAVVGTGYWRYQIGWFKHLKETAYAGYTVSTEIALNSAGRIFVHSGGSNTSRTVDIYPVAAQNSDLVADLAVNNSLVVRNTTSPTEYFSGDISAVADHPTLSGVKRVTLINGAHSGEISVGDTVRLTTQKSNGLLFRARKNAASGSGYTFTGVPWEYSIIDLRLYFGTKDLNAESEVGRIRGFEGTVLNEPSAQSGKGGLTVFDSATGKQKAVFIADTTYAADAPTFALQERTYSTTRVFLQANWHNVPGLDTTSVGYDFVLSRELVADQHPGPGQAHLNRTTNTLIVNVQEKIGESTSASFGMSRLVKDTIIQLEQRANGRTWTASIDSVTRQGDLGVLACTLLEDRGSAAFFTGSEIKIFAQGYGTGELPTISNLDTATDAVMGQFLQARWNAVGNPFGRDLLLWISSEHGGEYYQKHQRAWSNETMETALRTETLTAGSWSSALSPGDDLVTGASTLNVNAAAVDAVTIVPATATNKPGTAAGLCYTWKRDDSTLAQIFITPSTIHWRVTTTSALTTYGSWTTGQPADAVMARVPNTANGLLHPFPINGWRWLVESSSLTGVPALPESAHYAFARIQRGSTESQFKNQLFYYVSANNEAQKVEQTVTEGWGNWVYGYELPYIEARNDVGYIDNNNIEVSIDSLTFTPLPHTKYEITFLVESYFKVYKTGGQTVVSRIREDSGALHTGVNGTQRAFLNNTLPIQSADFKNLTERVTYEFTSGASPTAVTFHGTFDADFTDKQTGDNRPNIRHSEMRAEMVR